MSRLKTPLERLATVAANDASLGPLPIASLVDARMAALGLSERDLARTLPFGRSKTIRRLDELRRGRRLPDLMAALAPVLHVPAAEIEGAMAETRRVVDERASDAMARIDAGAEARHRTTRPHVVWTAERTIPRPIFVAVMIGPENLLRLDFPDDLPPGERVAHAAARCPERVLAFGRVLGFAINETPDRATIHARDGTLLGALPEAVRIGQGTLGGLEKLLPEDA